MNFSIATTSDILARVIDAYLTSSCATQNEGYRADERARFRYHINPLPVVAPQWEDPADPFTNPVDTEEHVFTVSHYEPYREAVVRANLQACLSEELLRLRHPNYEVHWTALGPALLAAACLMASATFTLTE